MRLFSDNAKKNSNIHLQGTKETGYIRPGVDTAMKSKEMDEQKDGVTANKREPIFTGPNLEYKGEQISHRVGLGKDTQKSKEHNERSWNKSGVVEGMSGYSDKEQLASRGRNTTDHSSEGAFDESNKDKK